MEHTRTRAPLVRTVLALALPTMAEQAMQTAVQYVDTAMVASLGTAAVAAVGSTTTVNWLFSISTSALSVGFLSQIAQARGAGDDQKARALCAQAVSVALIWGTFPTVLCLSLSGVIPRLMQTAESIRPMASRYFFILYTPMLARVCTIVFSTVLRAAGDTRTPMKIAHNLLLFVLYLFCYLRRLWDPLDKHPALSV